MTQVWVPSGFVTQYPSPDVSRVVSRTVDVERRGVEGAVVDVAASARRVASAPVEVVGAAGAGAVVVGTRVVNGKVGTGAVVVGSAAPPSALQAVALKSAASAAAESTAS